MKTTRSPGSPGTRIGVHDGFDLDTGVVISAEARGAGHDGAPDGSWPCRRHRLVARTVVVNDGAPAVQSGFTK